MRKGKLTGMVAAVAAGVALLAPASAAAQVPDADCSVAGWPNDNFLGTSSNEVATTFKVINGGRLSGATLIISNTGTTEGFLVRIRPVTPSLVPTNGVLAEVLVPATSVPVGDPNEEVRLVATFPDPPLVPVGGVYALTLVHSSGISWAVHPEKYYEGIEPPCHNSSVWVRPDNNPDAPFQAYLPGGREVVDLKFITYLSSGSFACPPGTSPVNGVCATPAPTVQPKPQKKKKKKKKKKRRK